MGERPRRRLPNGSVKLMRKHARTDVRLLHRDSGRQVEQTAFRPQKYGKFAHRKGHLQYREEGEEGKIQKGENKYKRHRTQNGTEMENGDEQ
jgi:hypothetical protein